jgi:hypothetical protein
MNNFNFAEVGFSPLKPLILNQKLFFQRLGFGIRVHTDAGPRNCWNEVAL